MLDSLHLRIAACDTKRRIAVSFLAKIRCYVSLRIGHLLRPYQLVLLI